MAIRLIGSCLNSTGKLWVSTMCQCRTFNYEEMENVVIYNVKLINDPFTLLCPMPSIIRLMVSGSMKFRDVSRLMPL